jgi:aryl-alcohol dehydrogenase-like predicted oxidoreductase
METRRLGRLEHRSSVLLYGAAALGEVSQDSAEASLDQALAAGINHFDVAASYGEAELRMGPWVARVRDRIFLASKTGDRNAVAARASIESSLTKLQTGSLDLLQLHAVGSLDELDLVTGKGGALEAALQAQQEGLVRAVGITGHGHQAPATHLEALRRFPFATVMTPLNACLWQDADYRRDFEALVVEVRAQDAGLLIIKAVARRNWPGVLAGQDVGTQTHDTWYEPLAEPRTVAAATSWVLAHEELTGMTTPGDVRLLGLLLAAERERVPLDEARQVLAELPDYSSPFVTMPF